MKVFNIFIKKPKFTSIYISIWNNFYSFTTKFNFNNLIFIRIFHRSIKIVSLLTSLLCKMRAKLKTLKDMLKYGVYRMLTKKSVIIASQIPTSKWYGYIGESTIADAIMYGQIGSQCSSNRSKRRISEKENLNYICIIKHPQFRLYTLLRIRCTLCPEYSVQCAVLLLV